jgi:hypothetical protein
MLELWSSVKMEAHVRKDRIDILGAALPKEQWDPLLDELKAEHVPALTPARKRMAVVVSPNGRIDAFIYRTVTIPDEQVIRTLGKYGIPAAVVSEPNGYANPGECD